MLLGAINWVEMDGRMHEELEVRVQERSTFMHSVVQEANRTMSELRILPRCSVYCHFHAVGMQVSHVASLGSRGYPVSCLQGKSQR